MSLPFYPSHSAAPAGLRMKAFAALVLAAMAGAALSPAAAQAQSQSAAATIRHAVTVPSGALGAALSSFAQQTGVLLSFDPALTSGMQTPGLQGSYGVDQGFAALLAGTGLEVQRRADGDYLVQRVAGQQAVQLEPVVVLGAGATTEGTGLYTADWMRSANGLVLSQRETPQSTSVLTRQQMDDRSISSVRDVMENATGMNVQQAESERLTYYSRGFSMDTFQFDGVVKPLNGIYQFGDGNLDPVIYDHVEIIRGATGLMSGTGNPGGSVNFIRKRPTREFQGDIKLSAGTEDTYRGEVDLSTPFNESGSVRGRIVGAKERRGDTMDLYKKKRDVLYGIVEADIADATTVSLGASVQQTRPSGISWGGLPALDANGKPIDWPKGQAMGAKWSRWDTDSHEYFAQLDHGFANGWNARLSFTRLENKFNAPLLFTSDVPVTIDGFSTAPLLRKFVGGQRSERDRRFDGWRLRRVWPAASVQRRLFAFRHQGVEPKLGHVRPGHLSDPRREELDRRLARAQLGHPGLVADQPQQADRCLRHAAPGFDGPPAPADRRALDPLGIHRNQLGRDGLFAHVFGSHAVCRRHV
ncbi:Vitamin B12 transporter BtuB [Achromobacter piechaudii]|uniref:Vitamin B12 transporter BtuB n=1 Tax=Achromobacter piechaudii TaxID=72556 RepID=A0A6S7DAV7_9BURK|nr:Vitamin B12 transporter BtuB [Achromobacter piechaudii]